MGNLEKKVLTPIIYKIIIQKIIDNENKVVEKYLHNYKFPLEVLIEFCIYAIMNNSDEITMVLLESVNYTKYDLHLFLELACIKRNKDLINYILKNKKIDPYCPERANVIHRAIYNEDPELQNIILKHF